MAAAHFGRNGHAARSRLASRPPPLRMTARPAVPAAGAFTPNRRAAGTLSCVPMGAARLRFGDLGSRYFSGVALCVIAGTVLGLYLPFVSNPAVFDDKA